MRRISLYYQKGSSDKEYHVSIVQIGAVYDVIFRYGRRGTANNQGAKARGVSLAQAEREFDKIVAEKKRKGYIEGSSTSGGVVPSSSSSIPAPFGIQLLNTVEDIDFDDLLADDADEWILQEKFDGERLMVHVNGSTISGYNRKGNQRTVPIKVADALIGYRNGNWVLDGELVGDIYRPFDLLLDDSVDVSQNPYELRFKRLHEVCRTSVHVRPVDAIVHRSRAMIDQMIARHAEGVVFRFRTGLHIDGRPNKGGSALKYKFLESATCIVMSVSKTKRSIGVGLLSETKQLVPAGNVTVPANQEVPAVGNLVEVRYLYRFAGGSLFQPVLLGKRTDISRDECTESQVTRWKAPPIELPQFKVTAPPMVFTAW